MVNSRSTIIQYLFFIVEDTDTASYAYDNTQYISANNKN